MSPRCEDELILSLVQNGISVEAEDPGRKRAPDVALLLALTHSPKRMGNKEPAVRKVRNSCMRQLDAVKSQRIEGRLAILLDALEAGFWDLAGAEELSRSLVQTLWNCRR